MSQRISNVVGNFKNADIDPAQEPDSGISGISSGAIVLRAEVNGPSGVNLITPPVAVTPSFTVT